MSVAIQTQLLTVALWKPLGYNEHPSYMGIELHNRKGTGRLVPTMPTGVEYRVRYGIHIAPPTNQHGRGVRPTRWARCSVRSATTHRIPNGNYFLHADEGGVFQLKSNGSVWHYLSAL